MATLTEINTVFRSLADTFRSFDHQRTPYRSGANQPDGRRRHGKSRNMRLTMFTDYALRTLILAASIRDRNVTIEEAASVYGISAPHLKKVVRMLTKAGFLEAHRGRAGGFRLAAPAEAINLGKVVRATETDFALLECLGKDNRCIISPACRLKGIANEARMALLAVFDRYSLADLILDDAIFGDLPGTSR